MDYIDIKEIFDTKTFYLIRNLINNPICGLYLTDYTSVDDSIIDPFDATSIDMTSIIASSNKFVIDVDCIYTYDKLIISKNTESLGSTISLVIYVRYDDIPLEIIDNINSLLVKFDNKFYEVENYQNLYNIMLEIHLN